MLQARRSDRLMQCTRVITDWMRSVSCLLKTENTWISDSFVIQSLCIRWTSRHELPKCVIRLSILCHKFVATNYIVYLVADLVNRKFAVKNATGFNFFFFLSQNRSPLFLSYTDFFSSPEISLVQKSYSAKSYQKRT